MRQITSTIRLALVWGVMTACGGSPQLYTKAPNSKKEAQSRYIFQTKSKDEAQKVLRKTKSYRTISARHNIYEVKGLDPDDILNIAPSASVEQNDFFEKLIKTENSQNKSAVFYAQNGNLNEMSKAQAQQIPPALQGCDLTKKAKPIVHLGLLTPSVFTPSITMELGQTVTFSGEKSRSHLPDQEIEIRWDIMPPAVSSLNTAMRSGQTLELEPDAVGMYQLAVVAKASDNSCNYQLARFFVTHNPEFKFATSDEPMPSVDLDVFPQIETHIKKINAKQAWKTATGKNVKIAILDTGLHYNHGAIKFNLAFNESEKAGQPDSDDDDNSFKDDILGWDFVNGDNKPFDDEGHGSHVAGLSSSHITGSAPDSLVLPVKVLSASGGGDFATLIAGIYYAADSGVQIINTSLSGEIPYQSNALIRAIEYASSKNIVFITASGNSTMDLSDPMNDIYPGEIDVPNVINVAATGVNNELASYSNFGKNEVDVAAPGGDGREPLYSLATLNTKDMPFVGSGGTSMAAPVVAGVAALLLEVNPQLTPTQIRQILMTSGTDSDALKDVVGSGQLLDASLAVYNALNTNTQNLIF